MPGSGVIQTPGGVPQGQGSGSGRFGKGRTAAGSPTDADLNHQSVGGAAPLEQANGGHGANDGTQHAGANQSEGGKSMSADSGKGNDSATATAYTAAARQNDKSQHPNVNGAYGTQSWQQDANGNWTEGQGFGGALGDASNSLQNQARDAFSKPLDNGSAARDQAINAAYGQATSRLNPQWANSDEQLKQNLASQGLDPNSAAYRSALMQQGQAKNDAYSSAMNGAIGQGTAAGSAVFNQNLAARNAPLSEMQGMSALLPSNQGASSQTLQALQAQQQAQLQQQQITADYVKGGADIVNSAVNIGTGAGSDARIKQNLQPLGYDAYPGIPAYEFQYKDAPDQNFNGVLAQDAEKVRPDLVGEDAQGIKHVHPVLAPKPVTWAGEPANVGDGSGGDPLQNLSDAQLQKLVHLGVIPDKQEQLDAQMAKAQALQGSHRADGHITGIGAGLSGLGDVFNNIAGHMKEDDVRGKRDALSGEQESGRMAYYKMLAQALRQNSPSAAPLVNAEDDEFSPYPGTGIVAGGDK